MVDLKVSLSVLLGNIKSKRREIEEDKFRKIMFSYYIWEVTDMEDKTYIAKSNCTIYDAEDATSDRISDKGLFLLDDESYIPTSYIKKIKIIEKGSFTLHSKNNRYEYKRLNSYMTLEDLEKIEQEYLSFMRNK